MKQLGARLVVSFELAEVRKHEGIYAPELTVEELLIAIAEYTRDGSKRVGGYDEDLSSPFLMAVDFAVADAAQKAVLAILAKKEAEMAELEAKNLELEKRIDTLKGGKSPTLIPDNLDDDTPF
ncbi:MAG: hypothetical protein Q7S34_04490 [bacterium]|nr:hypothetical protein [bacterium]